MKLARIFYIEYHLKNLL